MGHHDALFKQVFSRPPNAAAALAHVLPVELASRIDWASLQLEPGSFVDDELRDRHVDLLFSAQLGGRSSLVYLLYEHQSSPDPWMPLRVAVYVLRILDAHRARSPGDRSIPIVIPIVLHHGQTGWTAPRTLRALWDADEALVAEVGPHLIALEILVDDLARTPWTEVAARASPALVRVVLGVLRDAQTLALPEIVARWGTLMLATAEEAGREAIVVVLRYLLGEKKIRDPRTLFAVLRAHGPAELEAVAMDAFDRVRAEGKAEGKAEEKVDVVLRMLAKRGVVPPALDARVRAADVAELDRMFERLLDGRDIDDPVQ